MRTNWLTKKLGDKEYFEILGSGIEKFEGEKEYLSTSSIERNKIISSEGKITYENRPSRANMQPQLNSVWFARMQNTIKVYSFTEENKDEVDKYILSTGFAGILCNTQKVSPKYLEKIFLSEWFNHLKDSLAGDKAIQKSLNNEDAKFLEIPLPPLPIQQKIVSILDTIQSAIEVQEKMVEKTRELKKSMMAELFKYGAPSFRRGRKLKKTEIGEIPEDWEVVEAQNFCKFVIDGTHDTPKPSTEGYYLITSKNLKDGKIDFNDAYKISEEDFEKVNKRSKVDQYDVLFGMIGTIGSPVLVLDKNPKFAIKNVGLFKTNKKYFDGLYLVYYLDSPKAMNFLKKTIKRTTQVYLTLGLLRKFPFAIPKDRNEQREIAEILQTIDQKIEIEKKKKELYEELFKTMLNKIMNQEIDVEKLNL